MKADTTIDALLAKKDADKSKKRLGCFIFCISVIWILLYELWLSDAVCFCTIGNKLLKILNAIVYAIISGYVFLWLTSSLPENRKKGAMKKTVSVCMRAIASALDGLVSTFLKDKDWQSKSNEELQQNLSELSRSRLIWTEESSEFTDNQGFCRINPTTLFVIDCYLDRFERAFGNLKNIGWAVDEEFLKEVFAIESSYTYLRLSMSHKAAEVKTDGTVNGQAGNTYLDEVFKNELPILMFSAVKDNFVFIDKVRNIIKLSQPKEKRRKR